MPLRPSALTALAALVLLAGSAPRALAGPDPEATALAAPRLEALGRTPGAGRWLAAGPEGVRWEPRDGGAVDIAWDVLVALELPGPTVPDVDPLLTMWRARLRGGDVLFGVRRAAPASGETLHLAVAGVGEIGIPIEALRVLECLPPGTPRTLDRTEAHPPEPGSDVAYDEMDDRLVGTVLAFGAEVLTMEDAGGNERTMAWSRLRTLQIAEEGSAPAVDGLRIEVELADGTRLVAAEPPRTEGDDLLVRLRSLPATTLRIARGAVRALRSSGGAFVYATELPFTSEVETPTRDHADVGVDTILAHLWRTRVDRRAGGQPLVVGGTRHRRGFAVHSTSRVSVRLDGAFREFRTGVGIDDEVLTLPRSSGEVAATQGEVGARILGDDRVLWEAEAIRGGEGLTQVGPLDVSGVKVLVLEITLGPDGLTTLDRANWTDPLLVRTR